MGAMLDAMIASIALFLIPPYFANAAPVLFGGRVPLDGGTRLWDGRRLLGDGKTVKGLAAGIFIGLMAGSVEMLIMGSTAYFAIALLSSLGAMFGDLLGSFIKRRMGIERGRQSVLMDQLLFILCALAFSWPLLEAHLPLVLLPESVAAILVLTYFMHRVMNIAANMLGLKKVPW